MKKNEANKTFCVACNEEKTFCQVADCCLYGHIPSKSVLEAFKTEQCEFFAHRTKPPDKE